MLAEIQARWHTLAARRGRPIVLMEFCGTHTVALARTGIRSLLLPEVELKSGPGCPVCVTDARDLDRAIALASVPGVTVATFGDLLRVPGSRGSLQEARAQGADVQVVASPLDALQLAIAHRERQVVFLAAGFETTAPATAVTVQAAARQGVENFFVYSLHKMTPPGLRAVLGDREIGIDGVILPGHVSLIVGRQAWDFVAEEHQLPGVVAGFEPVELLAALGLMALHWDEEPQILNAYERVVRERGNGAAQQALAESFVPVDAHWRGLGLLPGSGLALAERYRQWDAVVQFADCWRDLEPPKPIAGCRCGDVLRGVCTPLDCRLFGQGCSPATPVGPCMVSQEGTCAAYARFAVAK